jgi:mRNA interferase YafQ
VKELFYSNAFKKDVERLLKRHKDMTKLKDVKNLLVNGDELPEKYKDHKLKGNWSGHRDLHIEPDWVLIYKVGEGFVHFARMGSHADLKLA